MTKRRTIEITIETHEITKIRQSGGSPAKCVVCGAEGSGYGFEQSAKTTGASEVELARLLETGLIHSTWREGRVLYICGSSLFDATENKRRISENR